MKKPIILGVDQRGESFALPLEVATQSIAILAKRGVGKTYTAAVLVEELHDAGVPTVIIDPTGVHWGMKSSADGKKAGLPFVVFGGEHADLPLEQDAGEVIARAIVEQRFPAIIDLSLFRKGQMNRFLTAFFETFYRINRQAVHLVCDEADAYAPQKPFAEEARTLGAMEDIVRRGRSRGIGCTLITQRPAVLNKNVLTQCEILIALRLVHPKDIDAIGEWVAVHGDTDKERALVASLPSLKIGFAWFWCPSMEMFERVQVRLRRTFDSSSTPKPGERRITPDKLAEIDISKLGAEIAATAQRAKESDPKELKSEVARLKAELAKAAVAVAVERVEVPVVSEEQTSMIRYGIVEIGLMRNQLEKFNTACEKLWKEYNQLAGDIALADRKYPKPIHRSASMMAPSETALHRSPPPARTASDSNIGQVGAGGLRRMMIALAQRTGLNRRQLGVRSGMSSTSGTFNTYLARLRTNGWIEELNGGFGLSENGVRALGEFDPLPEGQELLRYWLNELGEGGACRILSALAEAYPKALTREELGARANISPSSGTFNTYLSRLRTLELVSGKGELRATEEFFT